MKLGKKLFNQLGGVGSPTGGGGTVPTGDAKNIADTALKDGDVASIKPGMQAETGDPNAEGIQKS